MLHYFTITASALLSKPLSLLHANKLSHIPWWCRHTFMLRIPTTLCAQSWNPVQHLWLILQSTSSQMHTSKRFTLHKLFL